MEHQQTNDFFQKGTMQKVHATKGVTPRRWCPEVFSHSVAAFSGMYSPFSLHPCLPIITWPKMQSQPGAWEIWERWNNLSPWLKAAFLLCHFQGNMAGGVWQRWNSSWIRPFSNAVHCFSQAQACEWDPPCTHMCTKAWVIWHHWSLPDDKIRETRLPGKS